MANTRKTTTEEVVEELDLAKKIVVKSIAAWSTGFTRLSDGIGDITLTPGGSFLLSRNEVIAQIQNQNVLFCGTDGMGSHATLIISDEPTIKEVGFENAKQFSDELVKKLFNMPFSGFEDALRENIRTRAEKYALMVSIKNNRLNDYQKIRCCERYTGYKLENV